MIPCWSFFSPWASTPAACRATAAITSSTPIACPCRGRFCCRWYKLREERGSFLFERQERQEPSRADSGKAEDWVRCRYLGAAFFLQDRLFLVDYESLTGNEMTQTIFDSQL